VQRQYVKDVARGRWRALLPMFGVDVRLLNGKHQACPCCGGTDRFRFINSNGDGTYVCNGCGSGDGFKLAGSVARMTFAEVSRKIREEIENVAIDPKQEQIDESVSRAEMARLWSDATIPTETSPVGRYLVARTGRFWPSPMVRELGHCMICRVTDHRGRGVNLHRTFLPEGGWRPGVQMKRLVMRGTLPDGCAIPLWPAAEVMGIAEGVETAMSAAMLHRIPVWAAINGVCLSKWSPPDIVKKVVVFGDNDENFYGQARAYDLANKIKIRFNREAEVHIPEKAGEDWNDVLRAK